MADRVGGLDRPRAWRYRGVRPVDGHSLKFRPSIRATLALAAGAALMTLTLASPRASAPSRSPHEHLAREIEARTGLTLSPGELAFEDGRSPSWIDAVVGRSVMFCARERAGAARDLYRARVRVTPDGTVLTLAALANLTVSPLGDDGPLLVDARSRRVAFATRAFGRAQSVAVLDLRAGRRIGMRRGVTNLLDTGSWSGVERWDLRLDPPQRDVSLSFANEALRVRGDATAWHVTVDADRVEPAAGVVLARQQHVDKPLVLWAVDSVRGLSWVGPAPIAWLEREVFGARDVARRFAWRWLGVRPNAPVSDVPEAPEVVDREGRVIATARPDANDPYWPPPPVAPPLAASLGRERNEGVWIASAPSWLRAHADAPPLFYRTWVRLDAERPYARVHLLAMDMRQMELGMQAGVEDPVPLVGPRGDGRIPRRPELLARVVGAFNGAFKTEHGAYGMVVSRRVLLPPKPRAATVATLDDGRVAMGSWGPDSALPASLVSLRQNLDPLVDNGVENPTRRSQWGFVLGGIESMPTVRSGLCADAHGHILYVWSEETTARMMARAMRLAGCVYGMHLDMNPGHAAFHYLRVEDVAARQFRYQSMVSGMRSGGDRFLYYTLKDFFYLALRDPAPPPVEGATWTAAGLPQPPPRWLPALYALDLQASGSTFRVTSLALDRVALRVRAGREEPPPLRATELTTLPPSDASRALGAIEVGVSVDAAHPRGVVLDGRTVVSFAHAAAHGARLETGPWGVRVVPMESAPPAEGDALQGTLVVQDGAAVELADDGARPRLALGLTRDRRLVVLEGSAGARVVQAALVALGVSAGMLVETGAREPSVHWASPRDALRDAYPATTLFMLAREARSPVARLEETFSANGNSADSRGTVASTATGR